MDRIQQYPQAMDDHISIVLFPSWFIHIHDYKGRCHSVPKAETSESSHRNQLSAFSTFQKHPPLNAQSLLCGYTVVIIAMVRRMMKRSLHFQKGTAPHYSLLIGNRSQSGSTNLKVSCPIPAGFSSKYTIVTALQGSSTSLKFCCKTWTKLKVLSNIFVVSAVS